jgi:hypothetical protein
MQVRSPVNATNVPSCRVDWHVPPLHKQRETGASATAQRANRNREAGQLVIKNPERRY